MTVSMHANALPLLFAVLTAGLQCWRIELWICHRLEDWQRIDIWFVMEGRMDWGMATGLASDSDGLAFD